MLYREEGAGSRPSFTFRKVIHMRLSVERKRKRMAFYFIVPALVYMLAFCIYPVVYNLILGFQNMSISNMVSKSYQFVGLEQYKEILFGAPSKLFFKSLKNTFVYTVFSILFQFVLGFAFASLFSKKFHAAKFLRGIMLIAWLLPSTVVGLLLKFLFSEQSGIINAALMALGFIDMPIAWLVEPNTAMFSLIVANIWVGTPFNMLLLSTGMSTLPEDVYESADIEGASKFQKLIYITLPLLFPTIVSVITMGIIRTFKVFDLVYVGTGGGPVDATEVLASVSYRYSFTFGNFSLGAAVANMLLLILFAFSIFSLWLTKKEDELF